MTKRSPTRKRSDSKAASRAEILKIVSSWGGFEKLIAELSKTGDVTIEHNVKIKGKSGAIRQIDVLLKHTQGLYEHLIIVECKYWNKNVGRLHVDALATTVDQVNASKGVIFSTIGFQSGAITQAKDSGIDLFTVRFPTNKEWGLPGRYIDFFLHVIQPSIRNITLDETRATGTVEPISINLDFSEGGSESTFTQIMRPINEDKENYPKTLEQIMIQAVHQSAAKAWAATIIQDGSKWTRRFWCSIEFRPQSQILMQRSNGSLCIIPLIRFDLGLTVSQTRFTFDRADRFSFVFAIDDHIRNITKSVSREKQNEISVIGSLEEKEPDLSQGPPLENGSIMSVFIRMPRDFTEFEKLVRGELSDIKE